MARGKKLNDAVIELHDPGPHPDVELVFIPGFQFTDGEEDTFWTTWLSADGTICWPATWLTQAEGFPMAARVLSIKYDANVRKSPTKGRFDLYSLGESLMRQMYLAGIGQNKCPVVFVCHSVGGIVAKRIVLYAQDHVAQDEKAQNLLRNLKGFFFYATPHSGADLFTWVSGDRKAQSSAFFKIIADLFTWMSGERKEQRGPILEIMEELNTSTQRLNFEFMNLKSRDDFKDEWTLGGVGESCSLVVKGKEGPAVKYASSKPPGIDDFVEVQNTDHFTVCRPADKDSTSFRHLEDFIVEIHKRCPSEARQLL